jgi:glucose-6-phosphate isomerase
MKNINPTTTRAWKILKEHYENLKNMDLKKAFQNNPNRAQDFTLIQDDFYVDLSKNLLTAATREVLVELARECDLDDAINSYFNGVEINQTESRAVLHTALRIPDGESPNAIAAKVNAARKSKKQMFEFVERVIDGSKTTYGGKNFDTIVNIGIGGSDLGPTMIYNGLEAYHNHLKVHFVSNVEGDHVQEVLNKINPATTLFLIVSKSFTTQETLTNSITIRNWFKEKVGVDAVGDHFIAISSNVSRAMEFGVAQENIFPMFDWVGGRFSLWSTVGMSVALGIGSKNFQELLDGAHEMDQHFQQADFMENIPVQLALLTIWYNNFYNAESEAIIPYTQYLDQLPAYLQQAIMESNGKRVDRSGDPVDYQTGNIIWGEPGTNAQHAFFQLIHQGTKLIPCHFIAFAKAKYNHPDHHEKLMANFFAQTEALMNGKSSDQIKSDLSSKGMHPNEIYKQLPYMVFPGNRPTTTILIDELTPHSLGKLVAMYEHKIFVEGVIWNIYSYDQPGVQLGKVLADVILNDLKNDDLAGHDASTGNLLKRFKQSQSQ